ncbi:MAG TPA: hypothetical protein VMN57_13205 [Anaerolineales bacterium]|nr:hypothetical protein [Anaerolineales bacterium]
MENVTENIGEDPPDLEYCPKHPRNEARLRCNRCGRPMCTKCAVHTPTGYRCDDCVRGQQRVFITAKPQDYIFGPLVAAVLGMIGGVISAGFGFFMLLIAPLAGGIIAEVVRWVIGRRRSHTLFRAVTAAIVIGALLPGLLPIALVLMSPAGGEGLVRILGGLGFSILWRLVFAVLAAGAAYYRLSGLRL